MIFKRLCNVKMIYSGRGKVLEMPSKGLLDSQGQVKRKSQRSSSLHVYEFPLHVMSRNDGPTTEVCGKGSGGLALRLGYCSTLKSYLDNALDNMLNCPSLSQISGLSALIKSIRGL